jgi:hypothetical protein
MIWDFRGSESKPIAEHHAIHLKEFAEKHSISPAETGVIEMTEFHTIAHIDVLEENLLLVRDALIPHRGEWIEKE